MFEIGTSKYYVVRKQTQKEYDVIKGFKEIFGTHVKWLNCCKKIKNERLKIMFSINSYESDETRKTRLSKLRPYMTSNKERIVHFSECTILRKAPFCNV